MLVKRLTTVLLCVLLLAGVLCAPCGALVTNAEPPLTAEDAALVWKYVPGTGYRDAPSVPV